MKTGERAMKLHTRIFELCNGRYQNLAELARAMEISNDLIYRVRRGERSISARFIIGAIKAFPGYKLDDLFYVSEESQKE
jgi:hypothetical protein